MIANTSTSDVVYNSFNDYWESFGNFIPDLIVAVILIMLGFVLAWALESLVYKLLKGIKVDSAFEKVGLKSLFEKGGLGFGVSRFLSKVVYWFIIIVFLSSAAEILGLGQIQEFLARLVGYIPNVIGAVAILIIGILVARALSDLVKKATVAPDVRSSHFLVNLTKWSIIVFSIIAALVQLGVATRLLEILFAGMVIMVAIAGGLAFGLGGKDSAKGMLDRWKERY